jgi:hypothetical protein
MKTKNRLTSLVLLTTFAAFVMTSRAADVVLPKSEEAFKDEDWTDL